MQSKYNKVKNKNGIGASEDKKTKKNKPLKQTKKTRRPETNRLFIKIRAALTQLCK